MELVSQQTSAHAYTHLYPSVKSILGFQPTIQRNTQRLTVMEYEILWQMKDLSEPRSSCTPYWYSRMNISWLMISRKGTEQYRDAGNCRAAKGFKNQTWRCWSVFSCSEDASLRAGGAPETTVYLKVNLFTLLQWHADCLITARNKNIMWARAFAPHPAALFAGTQVVRRHLFSLPIFDSRHIK